MKTPRTLITAVTGAVTTKAPCELTQDRIPALLIADNLATTEEVDVYISVDGGTTWQLYYESTTAIVLTATAPMVKLTAPGLYGIVKDATAGACGVYISY